KKKLSRNLLITMTIVFIFGFFQAIVGWWMVQSGLKDNPYVSTYILAFHLANALIIFSLLFWLSLSQFYGKEKNYYRAKLIKTLFHLSLILIFITIVSGSFMAGTDAGKSFNTFPLMNEKFIPEGYYLIEYGWKNTFENTIAINFNHRWLAIFTFLFISLIIIYLLTSKKDKYNNFSLVLVLIILSLQIFLGILTIVYEVPLSYASLHQTNAVFLLASMLFAYHRLIYK
ncbi:MAG TPA: heme A synthase, partial [Sulfurimonas sp.]|nr:heme A synthase [Sulfurimonas sp.]